MTTGLATPVMRRLTNPGPGPKSQTETTTARSIEMKSVLPVASFEPDGQDDPDHRGKRGEEIRQRPAEHDSHHRSVSR